MRTPTGLRELKAKLLENFAGTISTSWEADDIVVYKKVNNPDKYIMVAVDKDLLYSVEGTHFNYYESSKYNIDMKFQEVDANIAMRWAYIQCLIGDTTDNIEGIKGIGPKKAEKVLAGCSTHADYWYAVANAFEEAGKGLMDAIETMRLVNMYQLIEVNGEYIIKLWKPEDMQ
jgi:DNA polymerase-1